MAEKNRISPRSEWTTASASSPLPGITPITSPACYDALTKFFHSEPLALAVATEASSHPTGLDALFGQPWVYAGGGLGNMEECPLQVCIAGGTTRDSFIFASVCIVPECNAFDLAANDFVERLETAAMDPVNIIRQQVSTTTAGEYVTLNQRIAELNKFLGTGWICGEFQLDWQVLPSFLYITVMIGLMTLALIGTILKKKNKQESRSPKISNNHYEQQQQQDHHELWQRHPAIAIENDAEEEKKDAVGSFQRNHDDLDASTYSTTTTEKRTPYFYSSDFWSIWDVQQHWKKLQQRRPETACLDGLKVGSILWVIFGHVMAIQSSSGGGYRNPREFLPPDGLTTTLLGQLLFSSRFAVDTFLCISGYLVVQVMKRKLPERLTIGSAGLMLLLRVLRILPLYAACLGFWMFIAPHMGSGPFWYQWIGLLQPCQKWWWTNALFINNFVPWDQPTTNTCFYHSWYLAVDVQLFFFLAPWLVWLYKKSDVSARRLTICIWMASVVVTAYLAYVRKWSSNTFDGAAVALFDVEGYAKPHIRAQSYLAGMYVAMMPTIRRSRTTNLPDDSIKYVVLLVLSLMGMAIVSFITVTGAYARRACRYEEWPTLDDCGSIWRPPITFIYTAFSRALWSLCVAVIMKLSLEGRGMIVEWILSWGIWTPLAHLTFGAYLIHPIVIFTWQIGDREKETFRLLTFGMDYLSVCVVSFAAAAVAALLVELPFTALLQQLVQSRLATRKDQEAVEFQTLIPSYQSVELFERQEYGTIGSNDRAGRTETQ